MHTSCKARRTPKTFHDVPIVEWEEIPIQILTERLKGLTKQDTIMRKAIPLEKRIAKALYILGSSSEYRTVGRLFGVSDSMVCKILQEFCLKFIEF